MAGGRARRTWGWVPIAVGAALLARIAIGRVLAKVGHAAATLDDAYIHFQYARAIAEGHPFRYQAGAPPTSGATSLLWPAVLAPFWLVGFRDDTIVWPAWALSFAALGGLAWEARAITRRLAGEAAGVGAAAMVLAFPAFAWCAASGMEVVPFAWLLARSARRAADWAEEPAERGRAQATELALLAWGAVLMRPEGGLACVAIAAVIAWHPPRDAKLGRPFALVPLAAIAAPPLLLAAFTGEARSATALVKLLPGNPYYRGGALVAAIDANVRLLAGTLLDGEVYSAEFLPAGGAWIAFAGLAAIAVRGARAKRPWRAALAIGLALAMFVPCAYVTFLWNRLRYLWPFATGWLVGLACLARLAGDALARWQSRGRLATPIACGAIAGMFLMRMDWTLDDVAQSASGIDRQQVALGRWAKAFLPADARIGVNDTGAIAYFGDRRTFDVVGLTTRGEGKYWVAGSGSRLEHYERLHAVDPGALPTHFIVYPEWFACDALLGPMLTEATVTDASILGGQTMRAHVADYGLLGSGEAPWTAHGEVVDAVDVADLESEADHRYELLTARDNQEIAGYGAAPDGRPVVDGGRTERAHERFVAHLGAGGGLRAIARVEARAQARVRLVVDGADAGAVDVAPDAWTEIGFDVPSGAKGDARVELAIEGAPITVFHYWFVRGA